MSHQSGRSVTYYDRVLAAIAVSLLAGGLAGLFTPVAVVTGLAAGSVAATVFVYAGLFRNPPVPRTDRRVTAAVIVWHTVLLSLLALAFL